jgi:IS30 family transposase
MAQGMNNSAACREVGINRRTGTRWRYGRTVTSADGESRSYPPLAAPKHVVSARYLSEDERITVADEHRTGSSIRTIAALLDRAPSTISREINRNSDPATTTPSPPTSERRHAAHDPSRRSYKPIPSCATWSKSCWINGGAQSRYAGPCRCNIQAGQSCG